MKKKRQQRMSNRRRAVVATRKSQVAELKDARFADIARLVSAALEPRLEALVEAKVVKAMADLAERQSAARSSQENGNARD
ncbi:MAG: hypothetical protein ACYTAO_11345 [Planctomycetota bacterium]|jgi:hypothetical protein